MVGWIRLYRLERAAFCSCLCFQASCVRLSNSVKPDFCSQLLIVLCILLELRCQGMNSEFLQLQLVLLLPSCRCKSAKYRFLFKKKKSKSHSLGDLRLGNTFGKSVNLSMLLSLSCKLEIPVPHQLLRVRKIKSVL